MPDYNPDSLDAVVSRIEQKIDTFVRETQEWRAQQALEIASLKSTVQAHERFKYWLLGMAAAAGAAGGKILTTLFHKP
jgi:hypothetical protein